MEYKLQFLSLQPSCGPGGRVVFLSSMESETQGFTVGGNQQRQVPLGGGALGSSGTWTFSSATTFLVTSGTLKTAGIISFIFKHSKVSQQAEYKRYAMENRTEPHCQIETWFSTHKTALAETTLDNKHEHTSTWNSPSQINKNLT